MGPVEELGWCGAMGMAQRSWSSTRLPGRAEASVVQGPAQLHTALGKMLAQRPAATEGLARFRWSWLSPHVSFGNGASGLNAGNSRVASAQSKQLTHLLLLPLSRET